ncbi:hypothetical protein NDU88_005032 [Pleurodeles waltl]|uniref:Uncharacterized protein n=1 Tax=Pleurodeles waltl TaxID=8319 RepID=A0AAV7TVF6_PLEWA|nr:hypothetical protein NDU88_005032 [Pleurodeles waltl]
MGAPPHRARRPGRRNTSYPETKSVTDQKPAAGAAMALDLLGEGGQLTTLEKDNAEVLLWLMGDCGLRKPASRFALQMERSSIYVPKRNIGNTDCDVRSGIAFFG